MSALTFFERQVLAACLAGDHPNLTVLRQQAHDASVVARTHTGVGAYVDLRISESAPLLDPQPFVINDINLEVVGVASGVTTLLYINEGRLQLLEFATFSGDWPQNPSIARIGYLKAAQPVQESTAMVSVTSRDPDTFARALRLGGVLQSK